MPSKDTVVRTARIKEEVDQKLRDFMDREDLTYSAAISRLILEMDMPKSRKGYVNTLCKEVTADGRKDVYDHHIKWPGISVLC